MEFKKTIFKVDIYGEKLEVKKMTAIELNRYQNEMIASKDNEAMDVTFKMMTRQGVPKKVSEKMEMAHLNKLVSAVCGQIEGK